MEAINIRRSVRKYQDRPIEKETIEKLLRAAMQAPSASNQQPWEFIVIQDREKLNEISKMSPYSKMAAQAPLAIVLLGNTEKMSWPQVWQQDMGAAAENLLLEAADLGLGAVWLGVMTFEDRMKFLSEMFELKQSVVPFCVICVGYPEGAGNHFIDRFNPDVIHYEKY